VIDCIECDRSVVETSGDPLPQNQIAVLVKHLLTVRGVGAVGIQREDGLGSPVARFGA
jgi:hypothetical protein